MSKQEIIEQVPLELAANRNQWWLVAESITPPDMTIVDVEGFIGWDVNHLNQVGFIVVTTDKDCDCGA